VLGLAHTNLVNKSLRKMAFGNTLPTHRMGVLLTDLDPLGNAAKAGLKVRQQHTHRLELVLALKCGATARY
jgi:hypothetical protein